jgi:hypothetical protein
VRDSLDALRSELAQQGVDPDDRFGRWLLEMLSRGEAGAPAAAPPDAERKRRRPGRKKGAARKSPASERPSPHDAERINQL